MPTPFQHLVYANLIIGQRAIPASIRDLLSEALGAYLLGSTAADVQVITGQPRVATHFYKLDDCGSPVAVDRLLERYPGLADPTALSIDQAAFVTGYLVHLVWDELWARDIFLPYYRDADHWPDRLAYFLHHNALRVWLDQQAYRALKRFQEVPMVLERIEVREWLQPAPMWALESWRDWLVGQLMDPASVQTAEVFAERMHVPIGNLMSIVEEMAAGTYTRVPDIRGPLDRYERDALSASCQMLLRYWGIADKLEVMKAIDVQCGSLSRLSLSVAAAGRPALKTMPSTS